MSPPQRPKHDNGGGSRPDLSPPDPLQVVDCPHCGGTVPVQRPDWATELIDVMQGLRDDLLDHHQASARLQKRTYEVLNRLAGAIDANGTPRPGRG